MRKAMKSEEGVTMELLQGREVVPSREASERTERVPEEIISIAGIPVPRLFATTPGSALRCAEFFGANIRNPHTRRAYLGEIERFWAWCEKHGLTELGRVQPLHVTAFLRSAAARFQAAWAPPRKCAWKTSTCKAGELTSCYDGCLSRPRAHKKGL